MRAPRDDNAIPIYRDIVRGTGGRAGGAFTFTSDDNLAGIGAGAPYGDMDYHQNYWLRDEFVQSKP
jgi:hypothetical protein